MTDRKCRTCRHWGITWDGEKDLVGEYMPGICETGRACLEMERSGLLLQNNPDGESVLFSAPGFWCPLWEEDDG